MSDEAALEPWRRWLGAREARLKAGPLQAWAVEVRGVEVVLEVVPDRDGVSVRVLVPLGGVPKELSIVPAAHALHKKRRAYTGDRELDELVVMHLPGPALYGAFNGLTRDVVRRLCGRGVVAAGGALRLEPWAAAAIATGPPTEVDALIEDTIDEMAVLAMALRLTPEQARLGIAQILERDANHAVRHTYERMFRGAADVRDARARWRAGWKAEASVEERLALLTAQARDASLGLDVRQEAYQRLLLELPLVRIEHVFGDVPQRLGEALFPKLIAQVRAEEDSDESRAGARILVRLVQRWKPLPYDIAAEVAKVAAPHGEPEALAFFVRCLGLVGGNVLSLGSVGLLRLSLPPEQVLAAIAPDEVARLVRAAPDVGLYAPEAVGPLFVALLVRVPADEPALLARYFDTLARAHRKARGDREQHAACVRPYLDSDHQPLQVAALEALTTLGDVSDLVRVTPLTEGLFRAGRIKEAARRAVAGIRARERIRDESGALTLTEGADGGLALHADGEGEEEAQ